MGRERICKRVREAGREDGREGGGRRERLGGMEVESGRKEGTERGRGRCGYSEGKQTLKQVYTSFDGPTSPCHH